MSWLAKLFGDCGVVRFKCVTFEGDCYTGKMSIESFNNSIEEVEEKIKNFLFVEKGVRCKTVKIIGYVET